MREKGNGGWGKKMNNTRMIYWDGNGEREAGIHLLCRCTRRISEARSYDQLATTVSKKKTIFEEKRVSEQKKCLGNA